MQTGKCFQYPFSQDQDAQSQYNQRKHKNNLPLNCWLLSVSYLQWLYFTTCLVVLVMLLILQACVQQWPWFVVAVCIACIILVITFFYRELSQYRLLTELHLIDGQWHFVFVNKKKGGLSFRAGFTKTLRAGSIKKLKAESLTICRVTDVFISLRAEIATGTGVKKIVIWRDQLAYTQWRYLRGQLFAHHHSRG